jgi:hypothetical protein
MNSPKTGVAAGPQGAIKVIEISSWGDVPAVLKTLGANSGKQIRLDFPEPAASVAGRDQLIANQEAIKAFFRDISVKGFTAAHAALDGDAKQVLGKIKQFQKLAVSVTELYRVDKDRVSDTPKLVGLIVEQQKSNHKAHSVIAVQPDCAAEFAAALSTTLGKHDKDTAPKLANIKIWVGDSSPRFGRLKEDLPTVEQLSVEDFLKRYAGKSDKNTVANKNASTDTAKGAEQETTQAGGEPKVENEPEYVFVVT